MAAYTWTAAQKAAIDARNTNLAVSAAAGSGKTAVLTARIIDSLCRADGIDISRLAVVTYTKAAAHELRQRLYEGLSAAAAKNPADRHIARQLLQISRARISTIHSFCLSLIRDHRKELSLGTGFRVCDPVEAEMQMREAAEETAEEAIAAAQKGEGLFGFDRLYRLFTTSRNDEGLIGAILFLYKKSSFFPGGCAALRAQNEASKREFLLLEEKKLRFSESRFGSILAAESRRRFAGARETLAALLKYIRSSQSVDSVYGAALQERISSLSECETALENGDFLRAYQILAEKVACPLPVARKITEEEKEVKETCKRIFDDSVRKELFGFARKNLAQGEAETLDDYREFLLLSDALITLGEVFTKKFTAKKREKGVLDYTDLEQLALCLCAEEKDGKWVKTPAAERITKRFDAVFVDEYQDTNRIQDILFRSVTNGTNLFIVGDPKQSIYRFRGAEPEIFTSYKNRLPFYEEGTGKTESKILLSENFRCDRSVIELTNRIFTVLMDAAAPDTLYGAEDRLVYSKSKNENAFEYDAELVLLDARALPETEPDENSEEDEEEVFDTSEAGYIAARIERILAGEVKSEKGTLLSPNDIAVIARSKAEIAKVRAALTACRIPCTAAPDDNLFLSPEFLFMQALLGAIDNPTKDVPLLGTLTSPVFRFTSDELYAVRRAFPKMPFFTAISRYSAEKSDETAQKLTVFLQKLALFREKNKVLTLSGLIWFLFSDLSVKEIYFSATAADNENLMFLLNAAKDFESADLRGIDRFLAYLAAMTEPTAPQKQDNAVSLMTIHSSKGLEFPVVFVSFLGKLFNQLDERATLTVSEKLGAVFPIPKLDGRVNFNTLFRKAAVFRMHREMLEEEKRILYVAFTRAREKLILTGSSRGFGTDIRKSFLFSEDALPRELAQYLISSVSRPLTWLFIALHDDPVFRAAMFSGEKRSCPGFTVSFGKMLSEHLPNQEAPTKKKPAKAVFSPDEMREYLDFSYNRGGGEILPKKLSVSEILKSGREEEAELLPRSLMDFTNGKLKSTASFQGSAMHEVMQFCDFNGAKKNLRAELSRLLDRGFISREQYDVLDEKQLSAFFDSSLFAEMEKSSLLCHEKRFNILLDGEEFIGKKGEILIQGVIDAYFEGADGTLTLLDFKTDRVPRDSGEEILRVRHGEQLRIYRAALEKMTGKPVSRLLIYSFALQKAIPV